MKRVLLTATVMALACIVLGAPSFSSAAKGPWPPVPKHGSTFVHFGEEHLTDEDGARIFPKVVKDSSRYRPDLVATSADKANDGTVENLKGWRKVMRLLDRREIPYFAGVGNHDRKAGPGFPDGLDSMGSLSNYLDVFSSRPYPFGDARPYQSRRFAPNRRPASDPLGASSHYAVEYGPVRWVFIDNSCFGIVNCDGLQSPAFPDADGNNSQYEFLASEAAKADAEGDLVFVVMHMPTQDDRPGHTQPTPGPHIMGEGISPDNLLFEQEASAAGVDAVFVGHVKGMWQYTASSIPYFTDGGAGGEVYVGPGEEAGVDYGYWHGYRLIQVRRHEIRTDAVPVFRRKGIVISGPTKVSVGDKVDFTARGQQPTKHGPDVNLQLRAPDPTRPNIDNLPTPAHIWSTRNPSILRPVRADQEDPRSNPRRQTGSGRFRAVCPGLTVIRIKSGWASALYGVKVTGPAPAKCKG